MDEWRPGNLDVDTTGMVLRLANETGLDPSDIAPMVSVMVLEADIRRSTPLDTVDFILRGIEARALCTLRLGEARKKRTDVRLPGIDRNFDAQALAMMRITGARPGGVQRRGAPSPHEGGVGSGDTRLGRRAEDKSATVGLVPFLR